MIFAVVSLILIFGVIYIGQDRVITRFEQLPLQVEEVPVQTSFRRIDVYKATIEIIKENPVFGIGFGGFRYGVSRYIDISGDTVPEQAHNDYLEYIASGGFVAVIFAVWFIFNFVSDVKRKFAEPSDNFSLAVSIGAISGIVGISIHNLFDFSLQIFANLLFFAALIVIAVHSNKPENKKSDDKNLSVLENRKLFKLSILYFLSFYSVIRFYSDFPDLKSKNQMNFRHLI